ncbi:MAG TPA: hypothetical protein VGM20_01725 [Gemmatimonadales bacterium]
MIDLNAHADDVVLTTREVALWLGISVKSVRRLPVRPVPVRTRERQFLAADVKAAYRGQAQKRLHLRKIS